MIRPKIVAANRSLLNRIRFQLGGGLLLAAILPAAVRSLVDPQVADPTSLLYSLYGTLAAICLGYYGFRRLASYPTVRANNSILPAFGSSYGAVLLAFLLLRLEYSRLQFVASFTICVVWFFIVLFSLRRQRITVGVLPFGSVEAVFETPGLHCVMLDDPHREPADLAAVVADLHADIPPDWERFLADQALKNRLVLHAKQVVETLTGRVAIDHLSENTFGSLIPGIVYHKLKRVADLVASVALLPVVGAILLLAAIAIRIDSPGPVLFKQPRMGFRGQVFTIYKLRTMRDRGGDDSDRAAAMTRDGDDRVTRVGRILRQYRIDELPQILNILKGEMSWIGPRPEAVPLSQWYEQELPFYRYRHIVRPGITGWAQVRQGHVAEVGAVLGKLHYDFYYIKNLSLWLDLLIVARTVQTVLTGFGAR